jgi:pyruvyl transferase EpsO
MIRILRKMQSIELSSRHVVPHHVLWNRYRDHLLRRSVKFIGGYGRLVTNRLHGMILGALLELPVTFEDNSYGKLSRYYGEWLSASDHIDHHRRQQMQKTEAGYPAPTSAMGGFEQYGT